MRTYERKRRDSFAGVRSVGVSPTGAFFWTCTAAVQLRIFSKAICSRFNGFREIAPSEARPVQSVAMRPQLGKNFSAIKIDGVCHKKNPKQGTRSGLLGVCCLIGF